LRQLAILDTLIPAVSPISVGDTAATGGVDVVLRTYSVFGRASAVPPADRMRESAMAPEAIRAP
jgi:hypothetical protein